MSKNKRMIYIHEDNLEFYDSLAEKSDFINERLRIARKGMNITTKEQAADPNWHPDPRIRETRARIAEMDARNKAARGN